MALFGGGRPDHPMAGIRQARRLVGMLPANDPAKALDEVNYWIESINGTEGFKGGYRLELIELLDHAGRGYQRKLAQEYLASDRHEKSRENKLWSTVFEFWKLLGDAYHQSIVQFQDEGGGAIQRRIPAIVARALRARALQVKWSWLRYGPIDNRLWGELAWLYLFAESHRIANRATEVYPGTVGQTTAQQEFLKALMLNVSAIDGLTPLKQEIAERAIAHFGNLFVLQLESMPGCNYWFDLAMQNPPARVTKGLEPSTTMRFFGAGAALPALRRLIDEVTHSYAVPARVNLGGVFDAGAVLSVMEYLAAHWASEPRARSSERHRIRTRLTVVHGFRELLRAVAPATDGLSLDFEPAASTESWIVEDVNEYGFGAVLWQVAGDWVKVGALLGVQSEAAETWGAGIIRRIVRNASLQRRVGIQLLAPVAIPVRLAPAGSVLRAHAAISDDWAVLLSKAPDRHGEIALLLRGGGFARGQEFEMTAGGKQFHLAPGKLVEASGDFDYARFKVTRRA